MSNLLIELSADCKVIGAATGTHEIYVNSCFVRQASILVLARVLTSCLQARTV